MKEQAVEYEGAMKRLSNEYLLDEYREQCTQLYVSDFGRIDIDIKVSILEDIILERMNSDC